MNQGLFGNPPAMPCPEPGAAKAWVIFKGAATQSGVQILQSYNVQSVTRNGLGLYTITFIRPFASGAFCYQVGGKASAGAELLGYVPSTDTSTAGAKQVQYVNPNVAAYDPSECTFNAWGAQ